jgi:glycosyltransferase involved in cell wall biosynthesis
MSLMTNQFSRSKLKVMLLTRQFWPNSSDATCRLRNMAHLLRRDNWAATVVTPCWHKSWPRNIIVEEIPVCRLEQPPSSPLRHSLFRKSLADWLDRHAADLDWIWCDEAGLDSLSVCSHPQIVRNNLPVVVRYCPTELAIPLFNSDTAWRPSQAVVDACAAASTIVAPNQAAQHQLLRLGIHPDRIVVCTDWIAPSLDRSSSAIRAARQSLAEINSDLAIRSQDKVVLVPGELSKQWELEFTIQAIVPLLDRYPNLRVWLHGEGAERDKLYESLKFHGHHRNVAMPGTFSCLETLLQAADLCLFPASSVGLSWLLPTCIVSGIPVLAANSADLSWHLGAVAATIGFESQSALSLQSKLEHWLIRPEELSAAVRVAGQLVRRQTSNAIPRGGLSELFRIPIDRTSTSQSQR